MVSTTINKHVQNCLNVASSWLISSKTLLILRCILLIYIVTITIWSFSESKLLYFTKLTNWSIFATFLYQTMVFIATYQSYRLESFINDCSAVRNIFSKYDQSSTRSISKELSKLGFWIFKSFQSNVLLVFICVRGQMLYNFIKSKHYTRGI